MLQKVDQDRLDKVLRIIQERPIKFPNATLERDLKANSGNISAYLKGTKAMSDNFYNAFIEKYGDLDNVKQPALELSSIVPQYTGQYTEDIMRDVARSSVIVGEANKIMAISNDKLVNNNSNLIEVIKLIHTQSNSHSSNDNQLTVAEVLQPYLEQIAEDGVEQQWWSSVHEGLLKLSNSVTKCRVALNV